jgi:hypothetical protein
MVKSRRYKKLRKRFSKKRGGFKKQKINYTGYYIVTNRDSEGEELREYELPAPAGQAVQGNVIYPAAPAALNGTHNPNLAQNTDEQLREQQRVGDGR